MGLGHLAEWSSQAHCLGSLATLVGLLKLPWTHQNQGAGWPEACLVLSLGGTTVREGGMKMYLYGNGHINGGWSVPLVRLGVCIGLGHLS